LRERRTGPTTPPEIEMANVSKTIVACAVLSFASTFAVAQAQPQMPMMGMQMTWPMIIGCGLVLLVLILAAAALIKYLVFR
jgi:hypothetical protein